MAQCPYPPSVQIATIYGMLMHTGHIFTWTMGKFKLCPEYRAIEDLPVKYSIDPLLVKYIKKPPKPGPAIVHSVCLQLWPLLKLEIV